MIEQRKCVIIDMANLSVTGCLFNMCRRSHRCQCFVTVSKLGGKNKRLLWEQKAVVFIELILQMFCIIIHSYKWMKSMMWGSQINNKLSLANSYVMSEKLYAAITGK